MKLEEFWELEMKNLRLVMKIVRISYSKINANYFFNIFILSKVDFASG